LAWLEIVWKNFGKMIDKASTERKYMEYEEFYHGMTNISVLVSDYVNIRE
jgi:hypothetical protein